jgi:hypothetical protein
VSPVVKTCDGRQSLCAVNFLEAEERINTMSEIVTALYDEEVHALHQNAAVDEVIE